MKKKIITIILGCLAIVAVGFPTWLWQIEKQKHQTLAEASTIKNAFVQQYGQQAQIVGVTKPKEFYIIYRKASEEVHASMFIDGLWIELGTVTQK